MLYSPKKIFIAGASGMIGYNLIDELIKKKYNVSGSYYKNPPRKNKRYIKKFNFENLNNCLKATKKVDTLFLLTMVSEGVLGIKNKDVNFVIHSLRVNLNLIEAALSNKVKKIVFLSSSTIYQPLDKPISEKMLNLNLDPYEIYLGIGWYYRYIEKFLIFLNKRKIIKTKIIRTSAVYGENDAINIKKARVIPSLIMRMLKCKKNQKFNVWGDPDIIRDFVYVGDVTKILISAMQDKFTSHPVNFSYGKEIKIKQLAKEINKQINKKLSLSFDLGKPSSANYRVLVNSRLLNYTKKKTNLTSGLKKTIKWYRQRFYEN